MKSTIVPCKPLTLGIALILFSSGLWAQPEDYYDSADATSPQTLRESLHEIIDDHQPRLSKSQFMFCIAAPMQPNWILISPHGFFRWNS